MAASMSRIYRELYLPASDGLKWKGITLNTGASASTLQDIKVPESCGGYTYRDSGLEHSPLRNRFIYWKACNDVLELVEESLDLELFGSKLRIHFQDTPILGGVSVHESLGFVIILVPTVACVHRLVFPHPDKLQRTDLGYIATEHPVPSVFHDASIANSFDSKNRHMLNPSGSITSQLHCAATYQTNVGEALFALASSTGSIVLVVMPPLGIQSTVQQFELTQSSGVQKWLTGLMPSMIRGGQEPSDMACSLDIHMVRGEACIFAVCKDHRLRIWSTKTCELLLNFNLLTVAPHHPQVQSSIATGSGHMIRRIISGSSSDVEFGVHLSFPNQNQFCILRAEGSAHRLQVVNSASIRGPEEDLIDFCLTPAHLVTLWTSSSGASVIRTLDLGEEESDDWREVILQPPEVADLVIPSHRDPREVYLERLFQPGRFSMQDITRALSLQVYSKALDGMGYDEANLNVNQLKQDVTIAVETEIRNAAVDYEMQEEDFYQLQLEQWSKFYSCCIQYHEVGSKLKGVFADGVTGLICLIRKGCITYLRPCDEIETLYCGPTGQDPSGLLLQYDGPDENELKEGLCLMWKIAQGISAEITEDLAQQFEQELSLTNDLDPFCQQLVDGILLNPDIDNEETGMGSLSRNLKLVHSLTDVLNILLRSFDLSQAGPSANADFDMDDQELISARQISCSKLFTSRTGSSILSASVQQFAETRLSALRDLLLLQVAALKLGDKIDVDTESTRQIERDLMPYTVQLLRAYQSVKWTTETLAVPTQPNTLEINLRHLATLEISESSGIHQQKTGAMLAQRTDQGSASLLDLFIQGSGGEEARTQLVATNVLEDDPSSTWLSGLPALVKTTARLIWPLGENFLFPEFLIGSCQYLQAQEYISQLHWCDYLASRMFLHGLCYLHFDEPRKAAQCFNLARDGVADEAFLRDRLLQTEETDARKLAVVYYLKVIKQFEEFGAPDIVISLAHTALSVADDDDPNVPTLWSKVFKYELELGHNTEAYKAMIRNPDPSRRKDCLRQLLIMLCERGDLQSLVDFPYTDLEEEVESILESRARSMDLSSHNYYNLLHAFHVFRNNFRKAGSVMYEQGWRLGREVSGKQGIQRQAQCYLAAMSALRLVRPEYAWIVRPSQVTKSMFESIDSYRRSPKHRLNGEEVDTAAAAKLEIVELHDIEKEYMLVDARLRLIAREPDTGHATGATPGPDEMVGLLVTAGMFDRALIVSRAFDLQLHPVFENLALRCVNLAKNSSYHMRGDNNYTAQAWEWLNTNNLTLTHIAKENSAGDQAWQLLQQYLEKYEDSTAKYHRCTANKLLSHGFTLPSWFVNSYKGLNFAELLRLYIDFDLLEEAVGLCVEYIDAVVNTFSGQDSHIFKLKGCLEPRPLTLWLPYTSIDILLIALQDHKADVHLGGLYSGLQEKLDVYLSKVQQVSLQGCPPSLQQHQLTVS